MVELHGSRFVLQRVRQRALPFIELRYRLAGRDATAVHLLTGELEAAFSDGLELFDPDDGWLVLVPDAGTFVAGLAPADTARDVDGGARLLCDVQRVDGSPHPRCVRTVLKRTLGVATQRGSSFYLGAAIVHRLGDAEGPPSRRALPPFAERLGRRMDRDGLPPRLWREVRHGHLFEYTPTSPLALADTLLAHRHAALEVADGLGLRVEFGALGGGTLAFLLVSEGQDYGDPLGRGGLSPEAAALGAHLHAEAPALWRWFRSPSGDGDPADLLSVGRASGEDPAALRVEGFSADADPHLAAAILLALALEPDDDPAPRMRAADARDEVDPAPRSELLVKALGRPLLELLTAGR